MSAPIDRGKAYLDNYSNRGCCPEVTTDSTLDFTVADHGSICILTGHTEACQEWIEENVGNSETQHWGQHGIVCEPRYVGAIVDGLANEGFNGIGR